ncbi:MAG TPA: hypothetical protein VLT89_10765 [Usitatibacter sp.]|nr:hypothetical protein [Usitatibacter sp.]
MKSVVSKLLRAALAALCTASFAASGPAPSVHGEPALAPKAAAVATLRLPPLAAPVATLAPVSEVEMSWVRQSNRASAKRVAIGIARPVTVPLPRAADLEWHDVPGGQAAQASVRSPDAGALRLSLDLAGVPESVQMVFVGSAAPGRLEGPVFVGDIKDRTQAWWSPVTDGDTQTVEFFVPSGIDAARLPLRVTGASHLFATLASGFHKTTQDIGASGPCNVDIQCSSLKTQQAFLNMRNAIAQMVFVSNDGVHTGTFLCTGQLLNDTDPSSQVPWFFSANHCFENENPPLKTPAQMQLVANTLATLWFFEAATCNSQTVSPNFVQLSGGATFIYNNAGADILFLRLAGNPPAGAFFAGWNANPLSVGTDIVVVHHPSGDLKKVSVGLSSLRAGVVAETPPQPTPAGGATTLFHEVKYSSGTTEGGSSGSGLYTFNGTDYELRGGLFGGGAFCSTPNDSDWYSEFDKAYPSLAAYLSPAASQIDYNDMWFDPNEAGMGLSVTQHASRNIVAIWYVYRDGGTPMWYIIPGGTWSDLTHFSGTFYATTSPTAASNPNFIPATARTAGTGVLSFDDANHLTLSYSIDGTAGTKHLVRQPY